MIFLTKYANNSTSRRQTLLIKPSKNLAEINDLDGFFMENNNIQLTDCLLTVGDLQARLKLSRTAVYAHIRAGRLPKPIKFGKSARWKASVISDVIANLGS